MTTGKWPDLGQRFSDALKQPAADREAWVRATCDDAALCEELIGLLRVYDDEPGFLEAPVDAAAAVQAIQAEEARAAQGRRIGPYRIVREIGRGGMGVVFEAARDDATFERRVAIKLLPAAWAMPSLAERFHAERQILASLDHPHIARLLDGGSTDDGVPYLVMELVEGQPIDAWCRTPPRPLHERVQLVMAVCEGVAHAHQQLVVHRDLKPANILVTTQGQPKLLDFGIATLVDDGGVSAGHTRTGQQTFTPEYASPEQVRGQRVTTSSDVYSLGVLLYLLVADQPPYSLRVLSADEARRVVCDIDPPPPSSVAPAPMATLLRGDLDAIVLKALRKEPAERYRSVFDLEADLRAWLDGRPVLARPASVGYRARKFVRRHRAGVAAATVATLAIVGGGGTAMWQARIASAERDKAENRFRDVQRFSRSLLFEVHESLRTLPGATEPRRLLLQRAVELLDNLAADAGTDDRLTVELAEGYRRLGQVQGGQSSNNVGDVAAAIVSFEKAVRLSEASLTRRPDAPEAIGVAAGAYDDLSLALLERGDVEAAEGAFTRHLALADALLALESDDAGVRASAATSLLNLGTFRAARRDLAGAQTLYERARAQFESLPADIRERDQTMASRSLVLKRLGALHLADGRLDEGEARYREALVLDEVLVARHPDNQKYRYDLTFGLSDLAFAADKRGDRDTAVSLWTRALAIREAAVAADPRDVRGLRGVANIRANLLLVARKGVDREAELTHARAFLQAREALASLPAAGLSARQGLAEARLELAISLLNAAEAAEAAGDAGRQAHGTEAASLLGQAVADVQAGASGDGLRAAIAEQRGRLRRP